MLKEKRSERQLSFYSTFEEQLNHQHPLYILARQIKWEIFETNFSKHYSAGMGAPAKPIRLMAGLLMLKHIRNLSDESTVGQWSENAYYQYFCGEKVFAAREPCVATELVEFRKRIGEEGIELIFKESIRINGKDGKEQEATTDTTVQEKNITFPTDAKLHKKIIKKCVALAEREEIKLRQKYTRVVKKLSLDQRFRNHPKNQSKARKADRKIKTIAGRLVRELDRNLVAGHPFRMALELFQKVLAQQKHDSQKIYSLHEPHVQCIGKGKEHKKYEFGSKVSIMTTKNSGVIIGAINIEKNDYDAHTLNPAIEQQQKLTGIILKNNFVDRGYRGIKQVLGTNIIIPQNNPNDTAYQKQKMRKGFRRRAGIEPKIGHLKQDHRLSRNFYSGIFGDNINVMLAATAMNFKRMMNKWKLKPPAFIFWLRFRLVFCFHIYAIGRKLTLLKPQFDFLRLDYLLRFSFRCNNFPMAGLELAAIDGQGPFIEFLRFASAALLCSDIVKSHINIAKKMDHLHGIIKQRQLRHDQFVWFDSDGQQ